MGLRLGRPAGLRLPQSIFPGWWIVAACVGVNFFLSISFYQGFQAFFLPMLHEFGWSRTEISAAFSLRQLEAGFMSPVVGILCDRFSPRTIILCSVVTAGLGIVLLGTVNSLWTFYLAFLLAAGGASGASHGISWAMIIANWFRRRRGSAMGIAFLGPVIGGPCTILVVLLEEAVGWRTAAMVLGVVVWATCVPLALMARTRPEPYGFTPDGAPAPTAPPPGAASVPPLYDAEAGLGTRQALRSRAFWLLTVVLGVQSLGVSGVLVHVIPLFETKGFSTREGAVVLGLIFLFSGIGRVSSGYLMDMMDRRRVLIGILAVQTAVLLLVPLITHEWWQAIGFTLVFGSAFGSTVPARPLLIRELFGNRAFGSLNGLAQGVAILPALAGPVMMGAAYDLWETYTPAVLAFVVITALTLPLPLFLRAASPARPPTPADSVW